MGHVVHDQAISVFWLPGLRENRGSHPFVAFQIPEARNTERAFGDRHRVTSGGHLGVIERTVQRAKALGLAAEGITAFSRDQFSSTSILVLAKNK
jgi:hypothetical protein